MFNVSDKIRLNPELCPQDKLDQKHFQFGALNYPVLVLDWECEVTDVFQDQYHGMMVAFKVLNDERVEPDTIVYFKADDCIISKETKLKMEYTILGKMLKVQPLLDAQQKSLAELQDIRAGLKAAGMSLKDKGLQSNWKEIQAVKAQIKTLAENTETVFEILVPKLGKIGLDCKEDQIESFLRREIRKLRAERKTNAIGLPKSKLVPEQKTIAGSMVYNKLKGVSTEPGQIAKLNKDFAIKIINEPKKPTTKEDNFVGIEIECFGPITIEEMKGEFIKAGLKKYVSIVTDGSIRPADDMKAMEIRVCVKESELDTILPRIFDLLETNDMEANASCGTHVHIDMRNRNPELAYSNFFKAQKLMMASQPKARRSNTYCKPNQSAELKKSEFDANDRYSAINTNSFKKHGTIEIRLHAGTVKYDDVRSWVDFLVAIASKTSKLDKEIAKVEDLSVLGLSESVSKHLAKRVKKYA